MPEITHRPNNLGDAFFYFEKKLIDIRPCRNHKDWLLDPDNNIKLPSYLQTKPIKTLFESYKLGWIRIVWDEGGKWQNGKAAHQGNSLYINGIDRNIWKNMSGIMNSYHWAEKIDVVVIEYLDIIDNKPKWNRTDIFRCDLLGIESFDKLYNGRKPNRTLAPLNATVPFYAEKVFGANRKKNLRNDL